MQVITVSELSRNYSKIFKNKGESYLLIDGCKRKIVGRIKIEEAPKEFEVIKKHLFRI
jgi:hypothetical protein